MTAPLPSSSKSADAIGFLSVFPRRETCARRVTVVWEGGGGWNVSARETLAAGVEAGGGAGGAEGSASRFARRGRDPGPGRPACGGLSPSLLHSRCRCGVARRAAAAGRTFTRSPIFSGVSSILAPPASLPYGPRLSLWTAPRQRPATGSARDSHSGGRAGARCPSGMGRDGMGWPMCTLLSPCPALPCPTPPRRRPDRPDSGLSGRGPVRAEPLRGLVVGVFGGACRKMGAPRRAGGVVAAPRVCRKAVPRRRRGRGEALATGGPHRLNRAVGRAPFRF